MSHNFFLMNMDKRLKSNAMGELGLFFFDGTPSSPTFVDRFWHRTAPAFLSVAEARAAAKADALEIPVVDSSDIGALVNLPTETIHEIFLHIEDLQGVAFLSLACQSLWEIGREHMNGRMAEIIALYCYAGDRILCAGANLQDYELPAGWLTKAEKEEFAALCKARRKLERERDGYSSTNHLEYLPCAEMPRYPFYLDVEVYKHIVRPDTAGDAPWHATLSALTNEKGFELPKTPAILRNLTKRHYFRESALRELKDKYAGTHVRMEKVNLGEIIMMRICLSSMDTLTSPAEVRLHLGKWAGHRFDIVTPAWLPDEKWVDVTVEMLKEFEKVWCDKHWR
ncbi:hypothetical protein C8R46DRAFT_1070778 [Mycena filopes]|nr:hypothetical protein C8R46DRAFT_1070778 [Mycena filopes]